MRFGDDRGSAPAEFVMVGALLTVLTLSVLQLGLALHVRNTVLDAASEGARFAALADNGVPDGVARTRDLITTAIGPQFAQQVTGASTGQVVVIRVRAPLPLIGLVGLAEGLEVEGHAPVETLDR
ncbi:MAG: pilus assembly protein TadE [Microbacteriaceae bacterium]|nr:pilus assembly protein TadE [Microbacteriaceae bacterium]